MPKIFISYRREDSQYVTDIVYEKMSQHFGKDNVFLDVGSIPLGVDFRQYLSDQIKANDVVLVIIGPDWARIMTERASQINDFVRIEIESALQQDKLIIPVLVKNATMPDFSGLPNSIQDLQWRNSAIVRRQPDLESDCNRLADGIRNYFWDKRLVESEKSISEVLSNLFAWIDIPNMNYSIGKYPITNEQFNKFIEAGGYSNSNWWTEFGWTQCQEHNWTQSRYTLNSQWNSPNQPVVGISWFEAVAFCLWLSEELSDNIMLPTEKQWQFASQGSDSRLFPWGNNWNSSNCCNGVENNVEYTCPVTHYEGKGDSPFGVIDMAGNVWEWCLTDYDDKSNNLHSNNRRVLCGGSWNAISKEYFRCDARLKNKPHYDSNYYGFRIART